MTNNEKTNNEITTVIIDDRESYRKELKNFLTDYKDITIIAYASNVETGIDAIITDQPDLVFLDIKMEDDDSGIQLANQIKAMNLMKSPCIVFMTDYSDVDYLNIAKLSPITFLKKPVEPEDISYIIPSVRQVLENKEKENVFGEISIHTKEGIFMINPKQDILYIESVKNSVNIHLEDGRTLKTKVRLYEYEDVFEAYKICRVGKSFLMNLYKLDRVEPQKIDRTEPKKTDRTKQKKIKGHKIFIQNHKTYVPLSDTYYKEIISKLDSLS
ncbi:MAG: response regulator transcription factor [Methylococcales bacterium]|nr:response regulator transcription factor [Methylococcales bacterium]